MNLETVKGIIQLLGMIDLEAINQPVIQILLTFLIVAIHEYVYHLYKYRRF